MEATNAALIEPNSAASAASGAPAHKSNADRYSAGTLHYTRFGLVALFGWLLWGDFCFILMETVVPSVLPLKLQSLNASNVVIGMLISTVPSLMNFMINPVVSFRSDRYRSRWGRRIPFLFWATPPLTVFLILLGYSEPIGRWLHGAVVARMTAVSPEATVLTLIAVFMVGFQIFNMFISSVYYYLFNDVVPEAFLGRFVSLFRIVGAAAAAVFNFYLFPHAQTHMKEIFLGAGLIYFVAFMLLCWKVREGNYPPPPPNIDGGHGPLAAARTYLAECFTHRFYWWFFVSNAMFDVSLCVAPFILYQQRAVGVDLEMIGKMTAWAGLLSMALLYPAGVLSDRVHPLRVMLVAVGLMAVLAPFGLIWLVIEPTPKLALRLTVAQVFLSLPLAVLYKASILPMYMRLLPKDRYGQFGSADAMVRSLSVVVAGPIVGLMMDLMKWRYAGDPFYYRYAPLWTVVLLSLSFSFLWLVYRYWKRHGADHSFEPPAPWSTR